MVNQLLRFNKLSFGLDVFSFILIDTFLLFN